MITLHRESALGQANSSGGTTRTTGKPIIHQIDEPLRPVKKRRIEYPFTAKPRWVRDLVRTKTISPIDSVALEVLIDYQGPIPGTCWIAMPTLAKELGRHERKAQESARRLESAGLIERRPVAIPDPDEPANCTGFRWYLRLDSPAVERVAAMGMAKTPGVPKTAPGGGGENGARGVPKTALDPVPKTAPKLPLPTGRETSINLDDDKTEPESSSSKSSLSQGPKTPEPAAKPSAELGPGWDEARKALGGIWGEPGAVLGEILRLVPGATPDAILAAVPVVAEAMASSKIEKEPHVYLAGVVRKKLTAAKFAPRPVADKPAHDALAGEPKASAWIADVRKARFIVKVVAGEPGRVGLYPPPREEWGVLNQSAVDLRQRQFLNRLKECQAEVIELLKAEEAQS